MQRAGDFDPEVRLIIDPYVHGDIDRRGVLPIFHAIPDVQGANLNTSRLIPMVVFSLIFCSAAHAQVVHYRIVGEYRAQTVIAYQETSGQATVTDRVTLELDWDSDKQEVVGPVRFQNAKSEVTDLRNVERSCPPPKPNGAYEHIDVTEAKDSGFGTVDLHGTRSYPRTEVTAFCQGSGEKKTIPAKQESVTEGVAMLNGEVSSFSVQTGDWTWTYTGTVRAKQ
jgi:hypothetical protein